ncbi:methyl-accepting chemotaxis protein [Tissierella carlieri]|uniref:methyl-accepting chemotaxis protein n=1 Tax=Tissierella carlieri TaxID=689904 RepID=UPI002804F5B7|nr:methyl-accepting chemotaxis protein [uncultured Tissierella sp.]MDU5079657.1 methyl-accepting chemotaxis protein [Bacillota bacterium]
MKLKSIKTKLSLFYGVLLLVICMGFGVVSYIASSKALSTSIDESLSQLAIQNAEIVDKGMEIQFNALEALAESDWLKGTSLTLNEKLKLLNNEVKRSNHIDMFITDINGNMEDTAGGRANVSDREYFIKALSGEKAVSDPIIDKTNGNLILCYAVPIKDGGRVKGVLAATRDGNVLSDFISDMRFGENSEAFMINKQGTTVASKDRELVMNMYNILEEAKADSGLKSLAGLQKKMTQGERGVGEYSYKGVTKYMGFAPVEGTNWSLAITAPKSEVMSQVNSLTMTMIIISIIFLAISIAITLFIAGGISRPIKEASDYLNIVATGNFTGMVPAQLLEMNDETGTLAKAIDTMQESVKDIIKEVVSESSNVSQMLVDINSDMRKLNKSIEEISATTEELSATTEENAASTEEMSATSTEIEKAIESTAYRAQEGAATVSDINKMSENMKQKAISSREDTIEIYRKTKDDLQNAIEQSKEVDKINELSEAILAITSQTNLLALNAAIEAARAGEAGKGFAVVADEIRKLAEGSKNTVSRIQEVTKIILEGVNDLLSSSSEIMEFIDKKVLDDYESLVSTSEEYSKSSFIINDMVNEFSSTSEELLASMQNMVKAIDEIAIAANEEAEGATNIAQEVSAITEMSDHVIKLADTAKERSELLLKAVSKFNI